MRRPTALALQIGFSIILTVSMLLFYSLYYSVHQDLAGSALSGRLAVTLGESFRNYSIYFPPAEKFWFSLAVRLADLTGSRLDLTVVAMTTVATLFSTVLAYRIRRITVGASPWFLVSSVAVLVIFPILFKNVFGLREHMVALGLWPYLVLRLSDPAGRIIGLPMRFVVGLWMGATLLFKYLYSVVVVLVELADALVQRRPLQLLRTENIVGGGIVALYLFLWLGIDPSQRAGIGAVFSAIDANLARPQLNWLQAAKNIYFAAFFFVAAWLFNTPVRHSAIGLALVVGAVMTAWFQERWYSHHVFAIAMAYIGWWWMVGRDFKWWAHLAPVFYLANPTLAQFRSTAWYQESVKELDQALSAARVETSGKRVGILTMHPSPYNQYLAAHGASRWNASMNNSYVAAELKPLDTKTNAGKPAPALKFENPGGRVLHGEMLRLWEDMPPDVLILDHSHRWPLRYLDVQWKQVFAKDPQFNAILSRYRPLLSHRGEHLDFVYYVRTHPRQSNLPTSD